MINSLSEGDLFVLYRYKVSAQSKPSSPYISEPPNQPYNQNHLVSPATMDLTMAKEDAPTFYLNLRLQSTGHIRRQRL